MCNYESIASTRYQQAIVFVKTSEGLRNLLEGSSRMQKANGCCMHLTATPVGVSHAKKAQRDDLI